MIEFKNIEVTKKQITHNEDELVILLKEKNELSFRYLYDMYSGSLFRVILQIIPERQIAEDILQDAFLKIWHKIDYYDNAKGRLFTWMLKITRNLSIDMIRSSAYQKMKLNQCLIDSENCSDKNLLLHQNTDGIGLKKFINKLKPEYRLLIDMSYFKGYTCLQIAQIVKLPLGTVKTRLRFALLQLRNFMN